jgi:hypothetical protein
MFRRPAMARKMGKLAAILALFFVLAAGKVMASTTTFYGCLYCRPVGPMGAAATCADAPVDTEVGWVTCTETNLGTGIGTFDPSCSTGGNPCTTTNAGGGGGGVGGGGSGGGGSCFRGVGGVCAAECFSCPERQ